jgi:elongation factor Ts
MAEITAAAVKALREETGLGMMECKKALAETHGDVAAAKDHLRKVYGNKLESKAGRATSEGLVTIKVSPDRTQAAMIEVRCETDFCARNDEFKAMVNDLLEKAFASPAGAIEATAAMTERLKETMAKIGENMGYARGIKIAAARIGSYLHHNSKVGVIVGVDGPATDDVLSDLAKHITFADPMGIAAEDIPADVVAKEKELALEVAVASGKPKEIAEKMVAGKIRKFLEEHALIEQLTIREDVYGKKKIKEILGATNVTAFARFAVGSK